MYCLLVICKAVGNIRILKMSSPSAGNFISSGVSEYGNEFRSLRTPRCISARLGLMNHAERLRQRTSRASLRVLANRSSRIHNDDIATTLDAGARFLPLMAERCGPLSMEHRVLPVLSASRRSSFHRQTQQPLISGGSRSYKALR